MKYNVWITLVGAYEAESEDDAFDMALEDIAERDGMDIVKHEILQEEDQ